MVAFFQVLLSKITNLCREICQPLGVSVVANQRVCEPEIIDTFARNGILCVDRLGRDGRDALTRVSGATTVCSLGRGKFVQGYYRVTRLVKGLS